MVKQKKRLLKGAALALSLSLLLGSLAGCGGKPQENVSNSDGPTNTYTPPVNDDGYIVITMPKTLLGGKTAEELEAADKASRAAINEEETLKKSVYSALLANEDGTFSYYLTPEQYPEFQAGLYWLGCLRDPYTTEISQEFVTEADYTDIDENGIPWGVTVSVDAKTYHSLEIWYSALATVTPAICLGRYQVLCGVPGDEWAVHVTVKDANTGEGISEHDFPTRGEVIQKRRQRGADCGGQFCLVLWDKIFQCNKF